MIAWPGIQLPETLDFERPRLWVRRIEYPKYKIPSQPQLDIQQGPREASLIPGGTFALETSRKRAVDETD
ncbi:MAG: hypothetical protein ACC628_23410, partial [Pirellulaceae bacterium]